LIRIEKARITKNDGRGERIRTSDSCVPNAVLYQAELHPEADLKTGNPVKDAAASCKKDKRERG
jgi:hypothetical protein